ncbi:glycerophosphodiester phosphodiesterase [Aestuariibacter salexigens]|uniref:glycerophosphodiester phosphodiesterase n=1 Tax=Aestuariibacter salexigens TaxID=226010 RepID=UPI000402BD26|nr:glycerophosphodiester phosphodiesterase [Aestuariibacter salexigens]
MRIAALLLLFIFSSRAYCQALVIAHRGASGYLPEHSIAAAALAYGTGADYIEQDIVLSKDKVPVVLHDIHLGTVTDVERRFPERKRDDGRYYVIDFTLDELKQLRLHERQKQNGQQVYPSRFQARGDFRIATFEEHIQLVNELNRMTGKNVGLYAEIKAPAWHQKQDADISSIVLEVLRQYQLDDASLPIFIQCFDFTELRRWREKLNAKVKLIQLIGENEWQESDTDYEQLIKPDGLARIAEFAQGIGPWIPQLVDLSTTEQTSLMNDARKAGLLVHPYTFRVDDLPDGVSPQHAMHTLLNVVKVDGIFTDFSDRVLAYQQAHGMR